MNLWSRLPRPILVAAPLEGVSDTVYRQIIASASRPDVFFTEFTSADGYCSPGRKIVEENLVFSAIESPIIAQVWGRNPDTLYQTAKAISGRGFAGIDINMGCPDRTVVAHGCGAAMIDTPDIAGAAIASVKLGIRDSGAAIPISVKTRIGNRRRETERWLTFLLEQGIDALTIHGRTAAELSKVPAHWDEIGRGVAIRNRLNVTTAVIGNGDVADAREAAQKYEAYGVDGVMIGRGVFRNLWAFDRSVPPHVPTPAELLDVMERHIRLFTDTWGKRKNYAILKKFYKNYVNEFRGATEWRVRFMDTDSREEALALLRELRQEIG